MQLTPHFTLAELTVSQTAVRKGIDQAGMVKASPELLENLTRLAEFLEKIRALAGGKSIRVSSGYRCREVNASVGSGSASAHIHGLAADFTCPGFGSVKALCDLIACSELKYDQVIYEYKSWCHVSVPRKDVQPRLVQLTKNHGEGYLPGIIA